ncbi:EscU/YscU/HrcU family type III secretion system export apparatus switch protein [Cupriavidus sp. 30B13]|uniref:EscU/YscU/HrcU family type III secretion system export apparatus switch protein n=1 Tax=Cupriavidus sp. 30B13 TaxID=3384241 RepID=UPI003B90A6FA
MADEDFDKSETASAYKLERAREQGQVAKSTEITALCVFVTAIACLNARGIEGVLAQFRFDLGILQRVSQAESVAQLWTLIGSSLEHIGASLASFLAMIVIAAIAGNVLQTGLMFAPKVLQPDWTRLNPVTGLRRLFTMRTLFEALRACVKLTLLVLVIYYALAALLPQFHHLAALQPRRYIEVVVGDIASVGFRIAMILLLIAAVDILFMRRQFANRMRMSKREVRDEHKQREGDPRVRARQREIRQQMRRRSATLTRAAGADVVIANPTHLAVALEYRHGQMESPRVVAKGGGPLALAIRRIAHQHGVPVVENRPLARALFRQLDIGHHVPQSLYADVARIMVWVLAMQRSRRAALQLATGSPEREAIK